MTCKRNLRAFTFLSRSIVIGATRSHNVYEAEECLKKIKVRSTQLHVLNSVQDDCHPNRSVCQLSTRVTRDKLNISSNNIKFRL